MQKRSDAQVAIANSLPEKMLGDIREWLLERHCCIRMPTRADLVFIIIIRIIIIIIKNEQ